MCLTLADQVIWNVSHRLCISILLTNILYNEEISLKSYYNLKLNRILMLEYLPFTIYDSNMAYFSHRKCPYSDWINCFSSHRIRQFYFFIQKKIWKFHSVHSEQCFFCRFCFQQQIRFWVYKYRIWACACAYLTDTQRKKKQLKNTVRWKY